MMNNFHKMLINTIPYEKNSNFFDIALEQIETLIGLNITSQADMIDVLQNILADTKLRIIISDIFLWMKYTPVVPILIQIATNEAESVLIRRIAILDATYLAQDAVFSSIRMLALNNNSEIRLSAVLALEILDSKQAFELILHLVVQDRDAQVRGEAIRALSYLPPYDKQRVFDLLITKFSDEDEVLLVRAYALEGLGYLGDEQGLPLVIQNLTNEAVAIRFMAAFSLGELGNTEHIPLLEKLLTDASVLEPWGTVANEAKRAIKNINNRMLCTL